MTAIAKLTQRRATAPPSPAHPIPTILDEVLRTPGQPLDLETQTGMGPRFGHDFSRVRVHTDAGSEEYVHRMGAQAVTLGLDVSFAAGRYQPTTLDGQRLIAHELGHIVATWPSGPMQPMLQDNPPADHTARLREIISARRFREATFWDYLTAHGESIPAAQEVLINQMVNAAAPNRRLEVLVRGYRRRYPDRREQMDQALREATAPLRTAALDHVQEMWDQYESAAYHYAFIQWVTTRLQEERGRARRSRRRGAPAEVSPLETQYQAWLTDASAHFQELRVERAQTYDSARSSFSNLRNASGPMTFVHEDIANQASDYMEGRLATARRQRLRDAHNLQLLQYTPSPAVVGRYAQAKQRLSAAQQGSTQAQAGRERLEIAPEGESRRERARRLRSLQAARRSERRATTELGRAGRALTPEGTRDPEMRALLEWAQNDEAETEARVQEARQRREARLQNVLPTEAQQGLDIESVLNDNERWWIYQRALQNIGQGFPGFPEESTMGVVLDFRSRIASDRRATGIAADVGVGTYVSHGEGQYDVSAPAGQGVYSVQPQTVDLTRIFGLQPGNDHGGRRIFSWLDSHVRTVSTIGPDSADADVLAKLVYGFFGRAWTREQVIAYLEGRSGVTLPRRAPDASRVLAALLFFGTIAGTAYTAPIERSRQVLRVEMEQAILQRLQAQGIPLTASSPILRGVDASSGQFGQPSMVALSTFHALNNPRTGRPFTNEQATSAVMDAARFVLTNDAAIISDVEGLIRLIRSGGAGAGRSGPAVEVLHHYRETGTGQPAWIVVAYRHLREIAPETVEGAPINESRLLAYVGSSGNAISPHVHMSISVFDQNPGRFTRQESLGFLQPLDFFPMMRRRPGTVSQPTSPAPQAPAGGRQP